MVSLGLGETVLDQHKVGLPVEPQFGAALNAALKAQIAGGAKAKWMTALAAAVEALPALDFEEAQAQSLHAAVANKRILSRTTPNRPAPVIGLLAPSTRPASAILPICRWPERAITTRYGVCEHALAEQLNLTTATSWDQREPLACHNKSKIR